VSTAGRYANARQQNTFLPPQRSLTSVTFVAPSPLPLLRWSLAHHCAHCRLWLLAPLPHLRLRLSKDLHRKQPKRLTHMCNRSFSLCTRTQPPLARPIWHRVRPQSYTYQHGVLTASSRSHPRSSLEREVPTLGRIYPRSQRRPPHTRPP
jgi:hypothetical protein